MRSTTPPHVTLLCLLPIRQSALQTTIALGSAVGLGLVSVSMSLSIFATFKLQAYLQAHLTHDCWTDDDITGEHCWRKVCVDILITCPLHLSAIVVRLSSQLEPL